MKYIEVGKTGINASNLIMGCMRLKGKSSVEAEKIIRTSMEEGINYFEHADVYGSAGLRGECETIFGKAVDLKNASFREQVIIQSKCGIIKSETGAYDFSKEHILMSVDGILGRLNTEYLDFLLLHRPDTLVEPEEVAEAFERLYAEGKVRHFGVSNHRPMQVELLQKYVPFKLEVNQLQLSITHCPMIDAGVAANMDIPQAYDREGSALEYSRLKDMTIQAWSPFHQTGPISSSSSNPFIGDFERYGKLNEVMTRLAKKYEVTENAIAVAWITRHPANMQVILGTMNLQRIKEACQGSDIPLTRGEWYELYQVAGKKLP